MQFSLKGRGNDNQKTRGRGEDPCPLPPPVKMSEGPLTHGNYKINRARSSYKARRALEKEQGQSGGAGLFVCLKYLIYFSFPFFGPTARHVGS